MTSKHTTPKARRDAEATLRAMMKEVGAAAVSVSIDNRPQDAREGGIVELWWVGHDITCVPFVTADTLDSAFLKAKEKVAND